MDQFQFHLPSPDEIYRIETEARRMQARAVAGLFKRAFGGLHAALRRRGPVPTT